MAIPQDLVEEVRERIDMVRLVGASVRLRQSGRRWVGLCPFHGEKTPSLSVSPEKKVFHCFGCGAGGDAFHFAMQLHGLDFQAAVRRLAGEVGVSLAPLDPEEQEAEQARQLVLDTNRTVARLVAQHLREAAGSQARAYLSRRRIPAAMAQAFGLGLGPPLPALLRAAGWDADEGHARLAAAGLAGDDRHHYLLAGRLSFPIVDAAGGVLGFGGRRLDDRASGPKYVNSRQSVTFAKGRVLFGLHQAHVAIRRAGHALVVEGFVDVVAMHAAGATATVATLGTQLTADHAAVLRRLAPTAQLVFDADRAGRRAAFQASCTLTAAGVRAQVVPLPGDQDPAGIWEHGGAAALRAVLAQAQAAVAYFLEQALSAGGRSVEGRAAAAERLGPLIALLPSPLERDLYVHRLAERLGLSAETMRAHLGRAAAPSAPPAPPARAGAEVPALAPAAATPSTTHLAREVDWLVELLLFPALRARFGELADFAACAQVGRVLEELADSDQPAAAIFGRHLQGWALERATAGLATASAARLDDDSERANRTFADVLGAMKCVHLDRAIAEVVHELRAAETLDHATENLLRRKQELTGRRQALRNPAGAGRWFTANK